MSRCPFQAETWQKKRKGLITLYCLIEEMEYPVNLRLNPDNVTEKEIWRAWLLHLCWVHYCVSERGMVLNKVKCLRAIMTPVSQIISPTSPLMNCVCFEPYTQQPCCDVIIQLLHGPNLMIHLNLTIQYASWCIQVLWFNILWYCKQFKRRTMIRIRANKNETLISESIFWICNCIV